MTPEHRRRSIEASMPKISDATKRLIEASSRDPEAEFRRLEAEGHKIPGREPYIPPDQYE